MIEKTTLSIVIPTYNRVEKALRSVEILSKQCDGIGVQLVVLDNDSDNGEKLQKLCALYDVKYIKRKINIGPIANITRAFEEIDSKWLVLLADDDTPEMNFVSGILNEIRAMRENTFAIKLKTDLDPNQKRVQIESIDDFVSYNSDPIKFGSTLLLSSWIFDAHVVGKYLRFMYLYAGLQCGHVVGVMQCLLNNEGIVQYSEGSYLKWNNAKAGEGWSSGLTYTLMLSTLPASNFLSRGQMLKLANGAVGSRVKTILGSLLRYKLHNNGIAFDQISKTVKSISIKHRLIVCFFILIYPLLNKSLKTKYFNANQDKIGIARM